MSTYAISSAINSIAPAIKDLADAVRTHAESIRRVEAARLAYKKGKENTTMKAKTTQWEALLVILDLADDPAKKT